ncbi:MAG TPA: hypothetical protein VH744_12895 [Terriglobales bacterium]
MSMTWLFLILILSTLAVACVGTAIYLRVRRHMKPVDRVENEREAGNVHG